MSINSKQIMETVLHIVEHISDIGYQQRVWVLAEGPECDDFSETVCNFFDLADLVIKEHKDFGITDDQHLLLKKFRDDFEAFSEDKYLAEDFISSPEWKRIVQMAKEVLVAFNYRKDS